MYREIGSEFHKMEFESGHGINLPYQGSLVFSGRTAIETVLKNTPKARRAALPSFCCDSMIQPFRSAGIEVVFYPVNYKDGLNLEILTPEKTDILLWCNFFGFNTNMPDMTDFTSHGGIIIEDITHSLLSDNIYNKQSHYLVASIRKWEPLICGGYCAKAGGTLQHIPVVLPPEEFINQKNVAMDLKRSYLEDPDESKKATYLHMFDDSNHWLSVNYSGLTMDSWSTKYLSFVDVERQREIRRRNAKILYNGLLGKVQFLFQEDDMDCPLFVPILVENRNEIRAALIANGIYCPVHWPKPKNCESNIYDSELSLICDQRYNAYDMERIISILLAII